MQALVDDGIDAAEITVLGVSMKLDHVLIGCMAVSNTLVFREEAQQLMHDGLW